MWTMTCSVQATDVGIYPVHGRRRSRPAIVGPTARSHRTMRTPETSKNRHRNAGRTGTHHEPAIGVTAAPTPVTVRSTTRLAPEVKWT